MSSAPADMLSIDRHTSLYGPRIDPYAALGIPPPDDMAKLGFVSLPDRLDQIATLIRSLTYGEMMELAAALWSKRPSTPFDTLRQGLRGSGAQENDSPVTETELPAIWHRWSAEHGTNV